MAVCDRRSGIERRVGDGSSIVYGVGDGIDREKRRAVIDEGRVVSFIRVKGLVEARLVTSTGTSWLSVASVDGAAARVARMI